MREAIDLLLEKYSGQAQEVTSFRSAELAVDPAKILEISVQLHNVASAIDELSTADNR